MIHFLLRRTKKLIRKLEKPSTSGNSQKRSSTIPPRFNSTSPPRCIMRLWTKLWHDHTNINNKLVFLEPTSELWPPTSAHLDKKFSWPSSTTTRNRRPIWPLTNLTFGLKTTQLPNLLVLNWTYCQKYEVFDRPLFPSTTSGRMIIISSPYVPTIYYLS